jgi:hypothetical protein
MRRNWMRRGASCGRNAQPAPPSEHDRYVAKVNSLIHAGREDVAAEVAAHYRATIDHPQESGRAMFWTGRHPGWPGATA